MVIPFRVRYFGICIPGISAGPIVVGFGVGDAVGDGAGVGVAFGAGLGVGAGVPQAANEAAIIKTKVITLKMIHLCRIVTLLFLH